MNQLGRALALLESYDSSLKEESKPTVSTIAKQAKINTSTSSIPASVNQVNRALQLLNEFVEPSKNVPFEIGVGDENKSDKAPEVRARAESSTPNWRQEIFKKDIERVHPLSSHGSYTSSYESRSVNEGIYIYIFLYINILL